MKRDVRRHPGFGAMSCDNEAVTEYWLEHFVSARGGCSLCGNTGIIDTRRIAVSQGDAGTHAIIYCICPNGQCMERHGNMAQKLGELA